MAKVFIRRALVTLEKGDLIHKNFRSEGHIYLRLDDLVYRSVQPCDMNFGRGEPTLEMEYFRDFEDLGDGFEWMAYHKRMDLSDKTD